VSGFVLKGALVEFMPTFLVPLPNVTVFQYNPETMVHTWTQPEAAGDPGVTTSNPLAVKGNPGESFSFTLAMDANDDIADGNAVTAGIAEVSGIYTRQAALEMLLYPSGSTSGGLLGSVSAAAASMMDDSSSGPTRTVPESVMPVVLFIWGPGRIVPVRLTDLTVTERIYDAALNPTHAEAQISLRVLTPAELVAAQSDNDVLGNLATIAYTYTFTLRQALAAANLANAAPSVIGMIPH
jgi:hypothetical protein